MTAPSPSPSVALTVNLYDPTGLYAKDGNYIAAARRLLALCEQKGAKATFFTAGAVALSAPYLIQDIAAYGHEIAYLGRRDIPLTEDHPEIFQRESYVDKDRLEQLANHHLLGYRAPFYSLLPSTQWAIEKLGKLGFRYSSSLMVSPYARFHDSTGLQTPFIWPNGMVEIPVSVAAIGPFCVPYLSGFCLGALSYKKIQKTKNDASIRYPNDIAMAIASTEMIDINSTRNTKSHQSSYARLLNTMTHKKAIDNITHLLTDNATTEPLGLVVCDKNFKKGLPKK